MKTLFHFYELKRRLYPMTKSGGKIVTAVGKIIGETVKNLGFEIWDIEYKKIGADYHLTVTIDSANGISIDDCESVHRAIDPLLDEADPIEDSYYLDVSSPGIEREIRTPEHFLAMRGQNVCIKLFAPVDKKKTFTGIMECNETGDKISITENAVTTTFAIADIAKANTVYEF